MYLIQVCLTQLLFAGEQVTVYKGKEINEQVFWIDNTHGRCTAGNYELREIKIKNGKASTACDVETDHRK